ncbi:hypothetical protein [Puniceicoccus vermicola]|uniref:Uncharacterized protein n=1 Tax=Puniceicoccus vermicola TaxID=388746 RepID=A0A7X1AXK7_9BACT|nr:hypothetical protein [Puniceicoccus vermicola]MBC2601883.1 hypothetical protein [Puniceicoccus vermicola]
MHTIAFINNIGAEEWMIFSLAAFIIVVPFWQIFRRIGWPPALSLAALIPGVVIILLFAVAFGRWQVRDR